jgi:SAM-dependent methyltransferase
MSLSKHHHPYFDTQLAITRENLIPFIESYISLPSGSRILEIGCKEGAALKGFIEKGHITVGIEEGEEWIRDGMAWMKDEVKNGSLRFIAGNIFNLSVTQLEGPFGLIIIKDVIGNLPDRELLLWMLKKILSPGGAILFTFSTRKRAITVYSQNKTNKSGYNQPWSLLLPRPNWYLPDRLKDQPAAGSSLKNNRITIHEFEQLTKAAGYQVLGKKYFSKYVAGFKPREQLSLLQKIPYLSNLFAAGVYYIIRPE